MVTSRIWFTAAQKAELWERWKSRVKCCSDLPGTGSEEQDWRSANCDAPWRHRAGAAPESFGSAQA